MNPNNSPMGGSWKPTKSRQTSGSAVSNGASWGASWMPSKGASWGASWAVIVALTAASVVPIAASQPKNELRLLESTWDNAALVLAEAEVVDPTVVEAGTEIVLGDATTALTGATAILDTTVTGSNPFAGTTLETYYTPVVTDVPSVEDQALIAALQEAGTAVTTAEVAIAQPGLVDAAVIDRVNVDLKTAVDKADSVLESAIVDATAEQVIELEKADDALNSAVAAITEVEDEDETWISELFGWTPSIRYSIDRRGPKRSLSGAGVDIALIDSGITPVQGLAGAGKVINGPDLSTDTSSPEMMNLDFYGHGTHLAGIIAGNDGGQPVAGVPHFVGIAPDARLINVKVADGAGNTSSEQLVAGIEWVIAHKNDNGMNIRVLTLAFGADGTNYLTEPLAAAVEAAWVNGIVVVIAGGNDGNGSASLTSPAIDPYVMAVAASDQNVPGVLTDDSIATFSNAGNGIRNPDLAAPGKSIVSLRVPGGYADINFPESRIGGRFAVASGTSQSAAVMAGTVALLLEKDPSLTPDQVKTLFKTGAKNIVSGEKLDGKGGVRLNKALWALRRGKKGAAVQQTFTRSLAPAGFGSTNGGWSGGEWAGASWNGASWNGASWASAGWAGGEWAGASWNGASWNGASWAGASWAGASWAGASWAGASWAGASWNGASWAGASWN